MNKYLSYVSDEHLLDCIGNLFDSYQKAKNKLSKKKFYKNKVDTIKLTFDANFNNLSEEDLIKLEISRQTDKSVNNAIGTFHEQILGGVDGFEVGVLAGFDVKAKDNTLFADIKNKHNTMNSSSAESLFQKLARYADAYKQSKCYWVQILSTGSFNERWFSIINGKEYSHSRVYKISGDQFYALITKEKDALFNLYKILPVAIGDFLDRKDLKEDEKNEILSQIKESAVQSDRNLLDQITYDNFNYYNGFDALE